MNRTYLAITLLLSMGLLTQSSGEFFLGNLTFETYVYWGQIWLPSGSYSLTLERHGGPIRLMAKTRGGLVVTFTPNHILAGMESGSSRVCLAPFEQSWRVRSVDLPEIGVSLFYLPREGAASVRYRCLPLRRGPS